MKGGKYQALVLRVVDGDTFDALVELAFGVAMRFRVRLDGVDTPEKNTTAGMEARNYVRTLIEGHQVVLTDDGTEKYGRALAAVQLADGRDLTAVLVQANIGVVYHGGKKTPGKALLGVLA